MSALSGGCQCGAVRFTCESLDHASICHCRMCQKAFGNAFSPMANPRGFRWTRGEPKWFHSSNVARRGFCADCGTPLAYQAGEGEVEIMICTLDNPDAIAPALQLAASSRVVWADSLANLPQRSAEEQEKREPFYASIISHQHPDHDTTDWKPRS